MDLLHEWAHIARDRDPEMSDLFDVAAGLERDGYMQRGRAASTFAENWAIHAGEEFPHRDADLFHAR